MPIKTKRWNDPIEQNDGLRILVCCYRPRALPKEDETWDVWLKQLGPSRQLHAEAYGKHGKAISWNEYKKKYLKEQQNKESQQLITELVKKINKGETITLLCSSACTDEQYCHRSLLRELIESSPVETRSV